MIDLYKTGQKLPKMGQKLGKYCSQWVVSLSLCPPFVKIRRHVAQNQIYLVDLSSLAGPVVSDYTISMDSMDKDTARMRYEAYMSYYLSTPIDKYTNTL